MINSISSNKYFTANEFMIILKSVFSCLHEKDVENVYNQLINFDIKKGITISQENFKLGMAA